MCLHEAMRLDKLVGLFGRWSVPVYPLIVLIPELIVIYT